MYSASQKTITDYIELDGVGLHNGKNVNLCLKPAEVDSGIKFKRTDINNTNNIYSGAHKCTGGAWSSSVDHI